MQSYGPIEKFWRRKWYKLMLWKKFWVGNDSSDAPKSSKNECNFRLTWSIIFEKMKNFSFSCNKNGLVSQGMFWLLPMESPDHIEPKTYPQHGYMKLRSLWIWIWSHLLWLQKKLFFEGSRSPETPKMMMNSESFEIHFFFVQTVLQSIWCVLRHSNSIRCKAMTS